MSQAPENPNQKRASHKQVKNRPSWGIVAQDHIALNKKQAESLPTLSPKNGKWGCAARYFRV
jgi:hypothetical protein